MAENDFEKTEPATQRRREEARQEGNVARSSDLTAAIVLMASMLLLYFSGLYMIGAMKDTMQAMLAPDTAVNTARIGDLGTVAVFSGTRLMKILAPMAIGLAAVSIVATIGQVGLMITGKALQPSFSRLSPIKGLKNLVDVRAAMRLAMSLAKITVIAAVAGYIILGDVPRILILSELEVKPMFRSACELVFWLGLKLAALLLVLALIDYVFQRWKREHDLRMSKQEVKEELKRMEGDPLMKQRRSRIARQLSLQRISHTVPKADVVVTNPTHFAIALQYDSATMRAPKVVAKGADHLALHIRRIAQAHGVPLVERKALAQGLYRTVEVGQEVPPQFFNAVAEILAYVYRLSGRRTA